MEIIKIAGCELLPAEAARLADQGLYLAHGRTVSAVVRTASGAYRARTVARSKPGRLPFTRADRFLIVDADALGAWITD